MIKNYNVSCVITTYNSDLNKTLATIKSFLIQKNCNIQLVITDDGSRNNNFDEIEKFLDKEDFSNYILVGHEKNQGTVKNCISGLERCSYDYVKGLSPGDFLSSDDVLCHWVEFMEKTHSVVSFSDAIYYSVEDKEIILHKKKANPQYYKNWNNRNSLINQYFKIVDNALGATPLVNTKIFLKYLRMIDNKVKYTEDSIFFVMVALGEKFSFFEKATIYYEYGTGISTKGDDKWKAIIYEECKIARNMLLTLPEVDSKLKQWLIKQEQLKNYNEIFRRIYQFILTPSLFVYKIKYKLFPRYTSQHMTVDYVKSMLNLLN